ncbi:hypothetical protein PWT90_06178 [Aphanocladium album]|nr:hypothetical protein PWT90_06178 [Aphanocladium album]
MEYEPVPKRRRTASPPLLQELNSNIQPQISPQTSKPPTGEDDGAYQQYLERAFADPRFRSTLAQIFDKYDRKSAQPDEAIDPALCGIPPGGSSLAGPPIDTQLDNLVHVGNISYHLDAEQGGPTDDHGQTVDYPVERSSLTPGPYGSGVASGYVPGFPGGAHPGLMQGWYGHPFQGSGPYPSPWDGFSGQISISDGPQMTGSSWLTPDSLAYNLTTWPPHATQPTPAAPPISHENPVLDPMLLAQRTTPEVTKPEERKPRLAQEDESTDNCQPEFEVSTDALGRKRRRRVTQPRFSKNGKRLGRPPKGQEAPAPSVDVAAYDGEGEDNGGLADLKNPAGDFGDEDDDTLWAELAEALQLASKATSKRGSKDNTKPAQKGEISATESDGAAEAEKDAGQAETMLRKIQQELIDRAVRRSTLIEEQCDDSDAGAEGRRRSGRERKAVNFGEQVSWDKVSAERKAGYKIKMHLRALSVQAKRERKKQEQEEAEKAAKEKEEADKKKREEEIAAAAAAAAEKGTNEASIEAMPSTIPDSQDTVTSLPIRTTPKKPQSKHIMRQTSKNHVNSVVHFEEEDEGLSNDEAPVAFPVKTPVFAYKKPTAPVNSFLGENYMDTVYALSDDEAPALLESLQRVSIGEKKKPSLVPVAVAQPRETIAASKLKCAKDVDRTEDTEAMNHSASKEPTPTSPSEPEALAQSAMDTKEAIQPPPGKALEDNEAARPPGGGDGNDSGIDIPSEQASSEQAERPPARRTSVPAEPLFQDPDLLGAADLLDSLDVLSETEDGPSSPVVGYDLENENAERSYLSVTSSKVAKAHNFEEPMDESMDIFTEGAANMPLMNEETESEGERVAEPALRILKQSAAKGKPISPESASIPPPAKTQYTNTSFVVKEKSEEVGSESDENIYLLFSSKPSSPSALLRHPLPQQSKSSRQDGRHSVSAPNTKASTPKVISEDEPSPISSRERSRLPSSSASRTPGPVSRSGSVRKGSSSSRRSLLSLVGGGEDDIESLVRRKPTGQTPKPASAFTRTPSSSVSKKPIPSSHSGSSHRKSKPLSSSSRFSLGSLSSLSRKSGKERQEATERRRKSTGATSSADTSTEKQGTCGVDGYTCGRDFCFTCL